jgi:hypothetical protein
MGKKVYIVLGIIFVLIISISAYLFWPRAKYPITREFTVKSLQNCDWRLCGWKDMNIEMTGYLVKMDTTNYELFDEPWNYSIEYEGLHIEYFEGYDAGLDKLKNHKVKVKGKIVGQAIAGDNWSSIVPALIVNGISDFTSLD